MKAIYICLFYDIRALDNGLNICSILIAYYPANIRLGEDVIKTSSV